ncbi:hypothetical protein HaLaN_26841, partial [Haematococcus lacustris]
MHKAGAWPLDATACAAANRSTRFASGSSAPQKSPLSTERKDATLELALPHTLAAKVLGVVDEK